ncbi:MAG: hypothetical protein A2675_01185 [Candidatus Yonathbacteria bacterium RIFCSPHIGHO2_01_FULL_51_10]|uniref:Uncharacterized protein n=1 Tax=Candidatus Yonathbacteria bacterium RIFCSPHIGHO2_01_FULL_51_10 TaxID=1802723 RepID=A0A1G2S759_9BACT|nr:MAG: hypothetical protein A2675_01185 [Candidatus Yonathbacteria bacterium RIFCSPHIGHO2_01_FULL_51_10]
MTEINQPTEKENIVTMKSNWKKLGLALGAGILVLGGACALTSCGGGSSSGSSTPPVVIVPSDPNGENVYQPARQYIEATYQDSAKKRAALFQYAKVVEKALADSGDKQLSIQHAEEAGRASECLTYTLGDDVSAAHASYEMKKDLRSIILNTDERNKAYFAYNDQLGGEVFKGTPNSQIATTCDISPATLPN